MTTTNSNDPRLKLNARNIAIIAGVVFTGGVYTFLRANSEGFHMFLLLSTVRAIPVERETLTCC
jgi:hypothetical protein